MGAGVQTSKKILSYSLVAKGGTVFSVCEVACDNHRLISINKIFVIRAISESTNTDTFLTLFFMNIHAVLHPL